MKTGEVAVRRKLSTLDCNDQKQPSVHDLVYRWLE